MAHLMRRASVLALAFLALGLDAGQRARPTERRQPDAPAQREQAPSSPAERRLHMTPAVACASIEGFGKYVALQEPAVTKDDKLLVYYEPEQFATEKVDRVDRYHFTQDVRVRRRGQKEVIWSKEKLLDYTGENPQFGVCLTNKIAVKGLTPGEYDLDIILHDMVGKGQTAEQTLRFRVKPSNPPPPGQDEKSIGPEQPDPGESVGERER